MKKIILTIHILLAIQAYGQKKNAGELYSQKFYKSNNEIFGYRVNRKVANIGYLYSTQLHSKRAEKVFPLKIILLGTFYPNLRWDIDNKYHVFQHHSKSSPEIGSEQEDISFCLKKNFSNFANADIINNQKDILSHNLTSLWDFGVKRIMDSRKDYWHYNLILQKDQTLLMPVAYKDSLYLYQFTDRAWTKPDYQGAEKNVANDKWTRIGQVKHDFKTAFRAFQIQKDVYFLANADTVIYKYENRQIKQIGRIKPAKYERTLFLIDKDDQKVYFLMAESIDIIAEERKSFVLLRKEDELYKAVQHIIDASDRK